MNNSSGWMIWSALIRACHGTKVHETTRTVYGVSLTQPWEERILVAIEEPTDMAQALRILKEKVQRDLEPYLFLPSGTCLETKLRRQVRALQQAPQGEDSEITFVHNGMVCIRAIDPPAQLPRRGSMLV